MIRNNYTAVHYYWRRNRLHETKVTVLNYTNMKVGWKLDASESQSIFSSNISLDTSDQKVLSSLLPAVWFTQQCEVEYEEICVNWALKQFTIATIDLHCTHRGVQFCHTYRLRESLMNTIHEYPLNWSNTRSIQQTYTVRTVKYNYLKPKLWIRACGANSTKTKWL